MFLAWVFLILGALIFIFGVGCIIRFLAYMFRGVGMTWRFILQTLLLGVIGFLLGLWIIFHYWYLLK